MNIFSDITRDIPVQNFVVEGIDIRCEMTIGGETKTYSCGDTYCIPASADHSVNSGGAADAI